MNFLLKVFISTILGLCFLGVLLASFLHSNTLGFDNSLLDADTSYPVSVSLFSGAVNKTSYSNFEDIYMFGSGVLQFENTQKDLQRNIKLEKQQFVSSLRRLNHNYVFHGTNFTISQDGQGELFIDTKTHPNKVFVLALTSGAKISLVSTDQSEVYTDIYLSPHMYLEFQPTRGKFLKNADRIRIETIYNLGYIPESLKKTELISHYPIVFKYLNTDSLQVFSYAYADVGREIQKAEELISSLKDTPIYKIPGYDYIERYIHSFINKEKQKIFYKNLILKGYIHILSSGQGTKSHISQLKSDMQQLKRLDPISYHALNNVYDYILSQLLRLNTAQDITIKKDFFSVKAKESMGDDFDLYAYSLYSFYDTSGKFSEKLYTHTLQAFSGAGDKVGVEYFIYFLEKQLDYYVSNPDSLSQLEVLIQTYNYFIAFTDSVYRGNNSKILTGVYIHADILSKVRLFLESGFFEEVRDTDGLLKIKNSDYTIQSILKLEQLSAQSFSFYEKNIGVLSPSKTRDIEMKRKISKDNIILKEYFLALQNPEEYKKRYDTIKKNSLDISVGGVDENTVLTQQNAIEYLSQFVGSSVKNTKVTVAGNAYKIEGWNVSGKNFDFELLPSRYHLMTRIFIDGKKQPYEYQLDIKKDEWDEKYKTAPEEEKNMYDFSRFFLITFFKNQNEKVEFYTETGKGVSEDKTEIVFKRDILLGDKGEFTSLKGFLPIRYENIRLEKQVNSYGIHLEDAPYSMQIKNQTFLGNISGEYTLGENEENRYFSRLSLTAKKDHAAGLFGGNVIHITGRVSKSEFQSYLQGFLESSFMFDSYYNKLLQIPNILFGDMKYSPSTQKMTYNLEKGGNTYTIITDSQKVDQVLLGTKKLLQSPIDIDQISAYIQ